MAFLIIIVWLLEFGLALAFLAWLEERMERSEANAAAVDQVAPRP
jgi:hypothetical protein